MVFLPVDSRWLGFGVGGGGEAGQLLFLFYHVAYITPQEKFILRNWLI